jgi:DNA-binding transcriptional ArsR family regulator
MSKSRINADAVFHALGDPTRRAMVEKLSKGPMSVSQLAEPLDITLTAVGQHLQILEDAGLVQTEKVGRVRSCSIGTRGFAALRQWIDDQKPEWEQRLDRLGALLAEPEKTG